MCSSSTCKVTYNVWFRKRHFKNYIQPVLWASLKVHLFLTTCISSCWKPYFWAFSSYPFHGLSSPVPVVYCGKHCISLDIKDIKISLISTWSVWCFVVLRSILAVDCSLCYFRITLSGLRTKPLLDFCWEFSWI